MHLTGAQMPTSKPRITLTLPQEQYDVLSDLAALQSVSMSSIVVDLIDTTLPALERLAIVLEHSSQAPQHLLRDIQAAMGTSEEILWSVGSERLGGADGSALAEAPAPHRPPSSNRGVRIPSPKRRKPNASAVLQPVKKGRKK
jgi:hypothetical protein